MGPEMLLLVRAPQLGGLRGETQHRGSVSGGKGEKTAGGRRVIVLGPIMIIFHHSNYIVECAAAAAHTQTHTATALPVQ